MNEPATVVAGVSGLTHRYGDKTVLDGINLEIPGGRMVGFIGPDGVGKSSLLALIAGVRKIQTGEIEVLGGDMRKSHHRTQVRSRIAYMPQGLGHNLYMTLSVFENVDFFGRLFGQLREEREARTRELLESTGLAPFANRPVAKLSGGMKRRLMIARALVHEPRLLILDEPTAGVDIEIRLSMWKFLRQLNEQGTTIILTTHYLEEAENLCRNIAIIHRGEIVEQSSMNSLLAKLHQQSFVLNLQQPLDTAPELEGFDVLKRDATTLEVTVRQGQSLTDLFCRLAESKLEVSSMRNKQNRLEQLFLELTSDDGEQQ